MNQSVQGFRQTFPMSTQTLATHTNTSNTHKHTEAQTLLVAGFLKIFLTNSSQTLTLHWPLSLLVSLLFSTSISPHTFLPALPFLTDNKRMTNEFIQAL